VISKFLVKFSPWIAKLVEITVETMFIQNFPKNNLL
jgi:hypothetical protein